jgi:hypothetical protein
MQTNRRIPAIVCLSMIVSGCANQDLFDNWNNADGSESNPDGKASDLSTDMALAATVHSHGPKISQAAFF